MYKNFSTVSHEHSLENRREKKREKKSVEVALDLALGKCGVKLPKINFKFHQQIFHSLQPED